MGRQAHWVQSLQTGLQTLPRGISSAFYAGCPTTKPLGVQIPPELSHNVWLGLRLRGGCLRKRKRILTNV